jgi:hypothetical protein
MEEIKKYAGAILILIAVALLVVPSLFGKVIASNTVLIVALLLLVVGLIVQIFVGKRY